MRRFIRSSFFSLACCLLLLLFCQVAVQAQVTYYKIVARHSGKCLDVSGGSTAAGALIHQWDCYGGSNQQWQVIDVGGGYSKIVARHSGRVADVQGGGYDNGTPVWQWDENGTPAQQWQLVDVGSGYVKIVARHSGKVMDVSGGSYDNGAQVHQWDYVGIPNQQWMLVPMSSAPYTYYEIVARHSGKCLDVDGGYLNNGALLHQWDCLGIPNQHWQIADVGGGYYRLIAQHSGKVADVAGGYLDNGTPIHQWDYVGIPNQQWALIDTGDGYYRIMARHSGKAMDVAGGYTTNGTQVHQWDYVGISNQQWSLRGVPPKHQPRTPTIIEPSTEGQLVSAYDVHMETGDFYDLDGDTHVCSDWEIWDAGTGQQAWRALCKTGTLKVHIHLGDGEFVNSYVGMQNLVPNTNYYLRVRHKDSSGDPTTEWSMWAWRNFRTAPAGVGGPNMWDVQSGFAVELVATGFQLPVNIAFIPNAGTSPDSPLFYVTELYGTIKVVTRNGQVSDYASGLLNFNPTGLFPGSGEQGLTGIVVDPNTGDVYASMLYDAGGPHYPKVVRFQSFDGGRSAGMQTEILNLYGETQAESHQISNLTIGPDGMLYIHMGDGGITGTALDLNSDRGKILRVNLDGSAPWDNPFYMGNNPTTDRIWAYGFRNPFGGVWRAADMKHYEVENGPDHNDRLARVDRGGNYGWNGDYHSMTINALYNWDPTVAPVNIAFIESQTFSGSGFPWNKQDHAFVSESGPTYAPGPTTGKRISEFNGISGPPTTLVRYTGSGRSTVAGLAAGPDGLYFTDLYKENGTQATDRGASVWRVSVH
jgi:glucose/arabinose dehydrogenase